MEPCSRFIKNEASSLHVLAVCNCLSVLAVCTAATLYAGNRLLEALSFTPFLGLR